MLKQIKIGYEVGEGLEVNIPLAHTIITGLTQEAGKTTALMGLIKRSGLKAVIIKTKPGEKAISEGSIIPPFFREDFDWEYAAELLESSRKEKLKFERSWIIKYSKGASNLLEFKRNIDNALAEGKLRELDKSVLISLQAYLEKILPELQFAPLSRTLDIQEGLNIMDLERFSESTQMLIIRSVLNEVLKSNKGVIVVLSEAWRVIPEDIATPVKRPAESFIRQGATNRNYLFLDSQDVTGTSKVILKQVSNWILGYQREINEIKRTIDQIPLPKNSKPKPEDIGTLKLGQFYVSTSESVKKVYAQPIWMPDETAIKVAKGELDVKEIEQPLHIAAYQILPTKREPETGARAVDDKQLFELNKKINEIRADFITNKNDIYTKFQQTNESFARIYSELMSKKGPEINEDEIVARVLQKINFSPSSPSSAPANEESIISKVLARIPKQTGSVTYEVAPLEKIKKDFLKEAKERLLTDISSLSDDAKKMLKYLEAKAVGVAANEMVFHCYRYNSDGGGPRKRVADAAKELTALELIKKDSAGKHYTKLKEKILAYVGNIEATPQDIELVYNHILAEVSSK